MENIQAALEAAGAGWDQLVKLSIHIVQGNDHVSALRIAQKFMGFMRKPPAVSVLIVAGLANPDYLIEVEAIAFVAD